MINRGPCQRLANSNLYTQHPSHEFCPQEEMASITATSFSLLTTRPASQLLGTHFGLHTEKNLVAKHYGPPKTYTSLRSVSAKVVVILGAWLLITRGITGVVDAPSPPVRATNLGAWLITEGWMTPWLFDGILNKDLLDGTKVYFKSVLRNKYLTAQNGAGGSALVGSLSAETFTFWRVSPTTFQFKVENGHFVGLDSQGGAIATASKPGKDETFEIIRNGDDKNRIRIRAPNGCFLQLKANGSVVADYSEESTVWGDDDPSVFMMTVNSVMDGEFQLVNGYGIERAQQVMRNHWSTYIVENDFKLMAEYGINAVRLPVGYWIVYGDNPPWPFVGGSLTVLDNAFVWGKKHGIKIIVDLHAVPGAANSLSHGGTRDGSIGWGKNEETINQTIVIVDFLAKRYAEKPNLLGIQMINEPSCYDVSVETLSEYYRKGHATVRKHSPACYVILALRQKGEITEFLQVASSLDRAVLDAHFYYINVPKLKGMSAEENIDYVNNERVVELNSINQADGRPLLFIGEWTGRWSVKEYTEDDLKKFVKAQVDLYNQATFGWGYWSYKCIKNYWSMEWMIKNGYLSFPVLDEVEK